jgi:hypothetical protein
MMRESEQGSAECQVDSRLLSDLGLRFGFLSVF